MAGRRRHHQGVQSPVNTRFCPDNNVTRGQMAAFLTRALDLPAASKDYFAMIEVSSTRTR